MLKVVIIELIMMSAYVSLIGGVIIFVFGLQGYDEWLSSVHIRCYLSIYIGIVLILTGYFIFRHCLKVLSKMSK